MKQRGRSGLLARDGWRATTGTIHDAPRLRCKRIRQARGYRRRAAKRAASVSFRVATRLIASDGELHSNTHLYLNAKLNRVGERC
ncbi:conserved hypothetical protein [Paraburkholderia caribensis]|nr:conserved hypothetical protein [Paraburkholderia caribensis]